MNARAARVFSAYRVRAFVVAAMFSASAFAGTADVPTSRNDDGRTGANLHEALLRPGTVNAAGFGKLFSYSLDYGNEPGKNVEVYAQPLYVSRVMVPGKGLSNLLLVATNNNFVIAFDADGPRPGSDGILWSRNLGKPPSMDDVWANCSLASPCLDRGKNMFGNAGVMSTPVIDRARGLVFLVARVVDPARRVTYRVHALDLRTGADRAGSPKGIEANSMGATFVPDVQNQRTGLAMSRGQVIISWGSYADLLPYHGWVMSYRYDDDRGFTQTGVFVTTPDGDLGALCADPGGPASAHIAQANARALAEGALAAADALALNIPGAAAHAALAAEAKAEAEAVALATIPIAANRCAHGGIWMAGRAPAIAANGDLLLMVGNGMNDMSAASRNFGNSLVKLDPFTLSVLDYFTPSNHLMMNAADLDFGGSGPIIIPDSRFVVGGGKEGVMHVWHLDSLGKFSADDGAVVQKFPAGTEVLHPLDTGNDMPGGAIIGGVVPLTHAGHIMGGPVYWPRGPGQGSLYNWSENSELRAYTVNPDAPVPITYPATLLGADFQAGHPGGILALSALGTDPGSGIVWAATYDAGPPVPLFGVLGALNAVRAGTLRAYSAENLALLWTSDQASSDRLGNFAKFTPPTIAAGRVYMATFSNQVVVYGLRGHNYSRPVASGIAAWLSHLLEQED